VFKKHELFPVIPLVTSRSYFQEVNKEKEAAAESGGNYFCSAENKLINH
jgi:hypothetical protein